MQWGKVYDHANCFMATAQARMTKQEYASLLRSLNLLKINHANVWDREVVLFKSAYKACLVCEPYGELRHALETFIPARFQKLIRMKRHRSRLRAVILVVLVQIRLGMLVRSRNENKRMTAEAMDFADTCWSFYDDETYDSEYANFMNAYLQA